jgi:hypothetical protein
MSEILQMWQRLEAGMEAVRATKALKEAVRALEVLQGMPGEAGEIAATAILRVEEELAAEVAFDDEDEGAQEAPEGT